MSACVEHQWEWMNRHAIHAKVGKQEVVSYVRCSRCGQDGFMRRGSVVVYTWTKYESGWET